jgi:hypothetical protein
MVLALLVRQIRVVEAVAESIKELLAVLAVLES